VKEKFVFIFLYLNISTLCSEYNQLNKKNNELF